MNDQPKSKRRGCFYGCLAVLLFLLVGAVIAFFGGRYWVKRTIAIYTETGPAVLPQVQMSAAEMQVVQKRQTDFVNELRKRRPVPPLVLTADDINALIEGTGTNGLKGKLYVSIEEDRIKGQVSVSLDALPLKAFKGRYLNGTVYFKVAVRDGTLDVRAVSAEVQGKPVPRTFMSRLARQNLAQGVDPVNQELKDIVVTNGTVILEPRQVE